jgi:hypothetical protein
MWHSAEALFRCNVQDESNNILYEKKIFLVYLDDAREISEKAEQLARSFETKYKNSEGGDVHWQFVKVLEIQELSEEELYDGVEVFSRLAWESEI